MHTGYAVHRLRGWEDLIPFVLKHSSQFRPGPPYAVDRKKYTADYNEAKSLGGDDVTAPSARTADVKMEARFAAWERSPSTPKTQCSNPGRVSCSAENANSTSFSAPSPTARAARRGLSGLAESRVSGRRGLRGFDLGRANSRQDTLL
jgi:hypothetical protein